MHKYIVHLKLTQCSMTIKVTKVQGRQAEEGDVICDWVHPKQLSDLPPLCKKEDQRFGGGSLIKIKPQN